VYLAFFSNKKGLVIRLPEEEGDFLFSRSSKPLLGLTWPSINRYGLAVLCDKGGHLVPRLRIHEKVLTLVLMCNKKNVIFP